MYSGQVESNTKQIMSEWRARAMQERTETLDTITASPLNLLANTLDDRTLGYMDHVVPEKGMIVPATYHHVYFPPRTPEHKLASDGYETNFHPPYPFDQRMWAGAELTFDLRNPLRVGDEAEMVTKVNRIEHKEGGRLGDSVMVWLDKDIYNQKGWSMREQRCLVYATSQHKKTGLSSSRRSIQMKKAPDFFKIIHPTSILLFRYSALTFNSHKIHYDQDYAKNVEKHPNCLVHGPLSSTLLISALRTYYNSKFGEGDIALESFQYRCLAPLYVDQPLTVCGRHTGLGTFELWINDHHDNLAVKGTAKVE
ncbi:hypothetical protein BDB00DRAFT_832247 [Zychaea mexicana]|uniref:uncharacterized protein n=1 Tax=Zychaea mexicana TaxID=64656 RepID=UPI0022FF110F|nr:uncharacterized protein BDB00DRAFT_832247 [Zychaea mexicana]KAI9491630.1 hypothetical protein BDB00DRAFT_832247 [Zychaea mexicana]